MALFAGVAGYKIILDVGIDISLSEIRKVICRDPSSGKIKEIDADVESPRMISFVTQKSTFQASGTWQLQAEVDGKPGEICTLEFETPLRNK